MYVRIIFFSFDVLFLIQLNNIYKQDIAIRSYVANKSFLYFDVISNMESPLQTNFLIHSL